MPTPLFSKMNWKNHGPVVVLNAPESFAPEMAAMSGEATMLTDFPTGQKVQFALAFAVKQAEVDAYALAFSEQSEGDALLWVAYPKGSSKKYKCDFNRDTGWEMFGKLGFEPVRMVAIDEDWSALRFRRVGFVKTMTRSFAMTSEGKAKAESASKTLTMPEDFAQRLAKNPGAMLVFENLAPSHRKEYVRWIEDAKRAETREKRLVKAVEMLAEGRKLS